MIKPNEIIDHETVTKTVSFDIPITREWRTNFADIIDNKLEQLEESTWLKWSWDYKENEPTPFKLNAKNDSSNILTAWFQTDGELFEFISWVLFWVDRL